MKTLFRLARYLAPNKIMVAGALASAILASGFGLLPPILIKKAVDTIVSGSDGIPVWIFALGIVLVCIFQGLFDFLVRYLAESSGHKAIYNIRSDLYTHLNEMAFSYYDKQSTGDIISRVTSDTDNLQRFFGFASVYITTNLLTLAGILVVLFLWSPALAFLYLAISPFMVHGMSRYALKVRPLAQKTRKAIGKTNSVAYEELSGIQVLKMFGAEADSVKRFNKQNRQLFSVNIDVGKVEALWVPYVFVLMGWGTGLVLWYGGTQVILKTITLGTLTGFISYVGMLMRPIRQTGMLLGQTINSLTSASRIFEVLDTEPEVKDSPNPIRIRRIQGKIEFKDVWFSYDKGNPVVSGASFSVNPGETVAVVGPTGAGKTTLAYLTGRFYDVDKGQVLLDGYDIRDISLADLRKNIGIVLQETFLFGGSIADNIGFGKPAATREEIESVAKAAQIHDFICSLPRGYDSLIGERGLNLSGGQRQRISIARTLLADPKVLILDEPTSNIDSQTEERITKALEHLFRGRTVFVIAHRLWTAKNAHRILVVERGSVSQNGSHDQLMSKPGPYRDLYSSGFSTEVIQAPWIIVP